MDMVDGALKMSDVGVFKRGTFGLNRVRLRGVQSSLLTQILTFLKFFSPEKRSGCPA